MVILGPQIDTFVEFVFFVHFRAIYCVSYLHFYTFSLFCIIIDISSCFLLLNFYFREF